MNVHITNIYGFIHDQNLRKKQNLYADAAHALGFKEMGIFNFDVSTDTENGELVNKKIHVTQGPLKNMDDYIVKYDKHNRLATLNLSFLNQIWKVGVTLIE